MMMETESAGFSDLLQQAEQLTAEIDGEGELTRVGRNLRQIYEVGQQLWSKTTQARSRDASDVKASVLLGSKGYDLQRASRKLETLSTTKAFEPVEPVSETDIQGFLKNERENAILSVIEEGKKSTFGRAKQRLWDSLHSEWEQEKQCLINSLMGTSQEVMDVTLDTQSHVHETTDVRTRSAMDNTEMAYSREVYMYNEAVIQGGPRYNLVDKFYKVAKELDDKNIIDLWEIVRSMTDISIKPDKDILASRCSPAMQAAFAQQARKYLEKKYVEFVSTVVYGHLEEGEHGGLPGIYFLVRSYLKINPPGQSSGLEDGTIEGHPVWAIIYHCLRCGDPKSAYEAIRKKGPTLEDFASPLLEYMRSEDRRLSPATESQIRLQYRRSVRTLTDPYKRAVYCILGCCEVNDDHSEVATKTEDYLWLRLCQLKHEEGDGDIVSSQQDRITLPRLQTLLLEEYGESHFNAYQQPFLYFQVLFLTAQFEAAIEFLSRIDRLRCHAVHIAIALYEMNLLALPPSLHAPVVSKNNADKPPMRRLNFARLLMMYTRKFETTDPREALQYFYLLKDLKGIRGENLFMACISGLVRETKEFGMLLGCLDKDGCRKAGAIDKFQSDTQKIIETVAADSENNGMYEDAIQLYDLAKQHTKVLELLNKLLSQVVVQKNTPGSRRERLETMAICIAERFRNTGHTANQAAASTFFLLLDLMTFFNQYHADHITEALDTIKQLKLIPFQAEEVEQRVHAFSQYSEEIKRNLPDVLLATMNILYSQYKSVKSSSTSPQTSFSTKSSLISEDGGQEKHIGYLCSQARALISFAGMIPYRMPGDTNARLVQMEVLMN